jgi:hypothetical protein
MCDYSLMMVRSRLAVEGEELVAHKFKSGSVGLVSCSDFDTWLNQRPMGFWQRIKYSFSIDKEPAPVVCIPPGAQLQIFPISRTLQKQFNLRESEEVTFAEISAQERQHRDALYFGNGLILLLGLLPEGQKLKVLRLSSREDVEPVRRGLRAEGVLQEI